MASLPTPIRATLGLLATALDAVQELVDHAPEIPMEAVGNSMQLSLRLQQQYVALQTRGDEFLASLRGAPEEPPAWATFDESPPSAPPTGPIDTDSAGAAGSVGDAGSADIADLATETDLAGDADWAENFESVAAVDDLPEAEIQDGPRHGGQGDPLLAAATRGRAAAGPAEKAPARKVPAKKVSSKKAPARKAPATTAPAKKVPAKKVPAKKAPAKLAGVKAVPAKKVPAKKGMAVKAVKTPARKTAASKKIANETAPSALDSAAPILTPTPVPAKRGRPAKKAGSRKAAAPQLDTSLSPGSAGVRHQSAFDLAESPTDVGTDGIGSGALTATVADTHVNAFDQPTSATE